MKKRWMAFLLAGMACLGSPARAEAYCFSGEEFPGELKGICLEQLPEEGVLLLGSRVLRPGDVLTAGQAAAMTFHSPVPGPGRIAYLPVFEDRVAQRELAVFSIPGRRDQEPVAEDSAMETYRNLPNTAALRVSDPEQQPLTVRLVRQPRRGSVEMSGTEVTYTPKRNKVGVDSFTYRAEDPAGNVSREATVTVTILKPSEAAAYQDTAGLSCSFGAEWMKNTGIFVSEAIGDACCFQPEKPVSRGEFLTMLLKTLEIPGEPALSAELSQVPLWLQPYAAAALRSGLIAGLPESGRYEEPVSQAEAAVMIQNALDLTVPVFAPPQGIPLWAASSVAALQARGLRLGDGEILTRGQAAELLYQVHLLQKSR